MIKHIVIATGIFAPDIGGPASFAQALSRRLSEHATVTVVGYSSVFRHIPDVNLPFLVVRVWKGVPRFVRHLLFLMKLFFRAKNADILLALNAVSAGVPTALVARIQKKKFVVRIVGDYAWEIAVNTGKTSLLISDFQKVPRRGRINRLHRLQVWTAMRADAIIVPSEYLASIVRGWGVPADKIYVIYNGVDFEPAMLARDQARKEIGISGNIILSVGRLVPWKGFRMLVKIMPQLLQVDQFFRLVVVGDGPDMPVLKTMARNLGLDRKVHLVGAKSQKDLALYLAAADIFVLNSGYEGFSHQLLEAMKAGAPIITTAVGGNKEIIHQGENGLMVKYNDEFNLIEAIRTLWQMPELRQEFIAQGFVTARQFSIESMVEETTALLTKFHA